MVSLSHVKTKSPNPDLARFPDFMILGPQRTGTTWLYFNLHMHPEILLHRMKETYYFSTLGKPDHPRFKFFYLENYLDSFRESIGEIIKKNYACLRKSLAFYRPKVIGEATASYAVLPEEIVAEIVSLNPDLKGIIMLRDPIERAWSHAKKTLIRGKQNNATVTIEELEAYLKSSGQRQRADYASMIAMWKKHLRPGHLHVDLYDRIASEPKELLADIERFLGVTTQALFFNRHLNIKLNPTPEIPMDAGVRARLTEFFAKDIASYHEIVAGLRGGTHEPQASQQS